MNSSSRVHTNFTGRRARLRQARRLHGRLAAVFAAVARTHVRHHHAHVIFRKAEGLGQFAAYAEGPLGSGPHAQLAVLPFGHRGTGLQRRVGDVGNSIGLLEAQAGIRQALLDGAGDVTAAILSACAFFFRYSKSSSLEGCCGGDFHVALSAASALSATRGAGGGDAHKVAVVHHRDARYLLRLLRVEGGERGAESRWPQNLAVEHPRQLDIGRIAMPARNDLAAGHLGERLAHDLPLGGGGKRVFGGNGLGKSRAPWPIPHSLRFAAIPGP